MLQAIPIVPQDPQHCWASAATSRCGLHRCRRSWPGVAGAVILLGTVFGAVVTSGWATRTPGPDWTDTGERFRDPKTDASVAVFFHATTASADTSRLRS